MFHVQLDVHKKLLFYSEPHAALTCHFNGGHEKLKFSYSLMLGRGRKNSQVEMLNF